MKVKIEIRTPKGNARDTERKIMPILIGELTKKKINIESYSNEEDDTIYWDIEGEARAIFKIIKNVYMYDHVIKNVFENKLMVKTIRQKLLKKEDEAILKEMLKNQTKVNIIKEATAAEMVEMNKTFWQRMKEKFKKN